MQSDHLPQLFSASALYAGYRGRDIIQNLQFSLASGEILGILGANGSGKTTLIKALCNVLPHSGSTRILGQAVEKMRPRELAQLMSYVPQRSGISIDMPALEVVLMGFNPRLGILENPNKEMISTARSVLSRVGFTEDAEKNFMELSEGQKQLVLIARALAADTHVLLMDEPEQSLDFRVRSYTMEIFRNWVKEEENRCAVIVLHDVELALNYFDKLLLLSEGEAELIDLRAEKSAAHTAGALRLETLGQALSRLYGPVSIQMVQNKAGEEHWIMLKEG